MNIDDIKFSTLDYTVAKSYLKIEEDFTLDDLEIKIFVKSAKAYVKKHTHLSDEELDEIDEIIPAVLKITSDYYHNRSATETGTSAQSDLMLDLILRNNVDYRI
ncbi:head-tail connector protein [uncultured Clostridium sp.]|uniref:head-tail connector protein n=1 Tax=uncultured Clostridium sp. TaxID=59620 RepID=UPI0025EEC91E|nr:head-tail connector protein [uncultured Clostridium sp.]